MGLVKSDYLKLLPILGLAFYVAFIPHQNYLYPLHVDEWVHLAFSEAMLRAGNVTFTNPFTGGDTVGLSSNLEAGFHLFWGIFQSISGISWLTIFRYFPAVISVITVLSVYILARREGFGWEAAFFTALIPSSIGILGPAFMVPVALGLLFIPLSLFLVFNFRTVWSYLALFVFICFLLAIHAPTAIGVILILIPYILLNLKDSFKHSLGIALAVIIPFIAPFPWIFNLLVPTARVLFTPQTVPSYVALPTIIKEYGYLPIALCLLGTLFVALRGGRKNYGLILGLMTLLAMEVTFYTFHYGMFIVYERSLMYMMLMLGIIAGAGLMAVRKMRLQTEDGGANPLVVRGAAIILCLAIIGGTLYLNILDRQNAQYYHMIDKEDYEAFVWIRDNVGKEYQKAILDPWKATAFTAITQKNIYTRLHSFSTPTDKEAYAFLKAGSSNTTFLRENGISIIYSRVHDEAENKDVNYGSGNPDLVELAQNIYLLRKSK